MRKTLIALTALLASSTAFADTLIYNVNGIQVGVDGKLQRFGGLVIDNQGKVEQLIQRTEELTRPIEREVDGGGRTLLPGLIDAHGHVVESPGGSVGLGLLAMQLDIVGTASLAELQSKLKAHAEANPGTAWIVGRGWNQELWPTNGFPTAADLDSVVADRPVWLVRVDGHAAVGNSMALKAAGITSQTTVPEGGKIEKDASGNPTGLFIDNAITLVADKIPKPTSEILDRALMAAQQQLLSFGITTTSDMGTSVSTWETYRRAGEGGGYGLGSPPMPTTSRQCAHWCRTGQRNGCTAIGCGWAGSRSMLTGHWGRAARVSNNPTPTSRIHVDCSSSAMTSYR